jgi:hypothetical protein
MATFIMQTLENALQKSIYRATEQLGASLAIFLIIFYGLVLPYMVKGMLKSLN